MDNEQILSFNQKTDEKTENDAWRELDTVVRKWAVMTNFEKDLNNYQKMKEMYQ